MRLTRLNVAALGALFMASSYFMQRFGESSPFAAFSSAFIILFAAPSCITLVKHSGPAKAARTLVFLSVAPLLVEGFAVWTGFPYGSFSYGGRLGVSLLGLVPFSVAFAYLPIILGSVTYASQRGAVTPFRFAAVSAVFNVLVDLVLDPAMVHVGFWRWSSPGVYYGVPVVNFAGWLLTGFIYSLAFYHLNGEGSTPLPVQTSVSLVWILCFWTGYLLLNLLLVPAALGLALIGFLLSKMN